MTAVVDDVDDLLLDLEMRPFLRKEFGYRYEMRVRILKGPTVPELRAVREKDGTRLNTSPAQQLRQLSRGTTAVATTPRRRGNMTRTGPPAPA